MVCSNLEVVLGLVPLGDDLVQEVLVECESVCVRVDDALKCLRVVVGLDGGLVVASEVVVQLNASRLLFVDHNVSNLQENAIDLRVVSIELACTFYAA